MELDFDPAEFIGPDLLSRRPNDDCSLCARHNRLESSPGWAKRHVLRNAGEGVVIWLIRLLSFFVGNIPGRLYGRMLNGRQDVLAVYLFCVVSRQLEIETGSEGTAHRRRMNLLKGRFLFFHAQLD